MADLPPELEDRLREELNAAQQCLPSTEAVEKLLNRVVPETDPVPDSEALDVVEEVMEFQEALEGVREALKAMSALLNPSASTPSCTRVHMLVSGLPFCGFTSALPRDWPADQKWCHTIDELLLNLSASEVACPKCIARFEKEQGKPLRHCAKCGKPFPPDYIGHNVTDTEWYCTPNCYHAAGYDARPGGTAIPFHQIGPFRW